MDLECLKVFSAPYYQNKDGMHNLWHIELVLQSALRLVRLGNYDVDIDKLTAAAYFHGFVGSHEEEIRRWLATEGFCGDIIEEILCFARESHATAVPRTLGGKILHDAHLIKGGKAYMVTKCLITGSLRGQTLPETIAYIENHIIGQRACYLPESKPLFEQAVGFTVDFVAELKRGLL
ncbi:MAG: hypothetical protein FWD25_10355 [Clostridia bacterium]|nr:hypothetical protein [Clostridia bacterium]